MKKKFGLVILATILLLTACGTPEENPSMNQPELPFADELQEALENGLEQYGGKGISAAVIVPGYETWAGVTGISHGTTPITPETVFDAGSIQKMFTAATILQLQEEGVLSLDDPLHKWLPDYPQVDNTITIRQLLNHTGGVFDMVRHPDYWDAMTANVLKQWEPEDILANFLLEPYFQKGEGWHYSTPGYVMLRLIIEEATGTDLATAYRSRLWDPLGLENTYLAIYEELPENTAHGWFDVDGDGAYEDVPQFVSFNSSTVGAVFSTAEDLAIWSQSLFVENRILSEQSLNQALIFHPTSPDEPLTSGYGLGITRFSPELFNGLEIWGHGGNAAGYAAGCLYLPDYDVSVVIMGNTEAGEAMPAINDLLTIITNHLGDNQ